MNKSLSYMIGADIEDIEPDSSRTVEVPYDAPRVGFEQDNIAYCNLFHENYEEEGPIYAPYLPGDDVSGSYGEGRIDPRGAGWRRNLDRQYELRRRQGHTVIELDNPDSYDAYFDYVMEEVEASGFKIIAKNPLLLSSTNAQRYVAHPNVIGVIIERSSATAADMHDLRVACGRPDLPLWFVAFDRAGKGKGWAWAKAVAQGAEGLTDVGVTYSLRGEYTNVQDVLPYQAGSAGGTSMRIAISSGHGLHIRGARGSPVPPQLDEVDEARRVVDRVASLLGCPKFHDNTSYDQNTNLHTIVNWHNKQTRDLDVSVHFNCYDHSAHGTEVLYVSQQSKAAEVSAAICAAGSFTNRGAKKRTDLFFLNNTNEPAVLIETCFCDNTSDSNKYNAEFDEICLAIAESISGTSVDAPPPDVGEPPDAGGPAPGAPVIGVVRGVPIGDRLNIRASGSSSAAIIGTCDNGAELKVVGSSGNWLKLEFGAGVLVYGWCSGDYVELKGEPPASTEEWHENITATQFGGGGDEQEGAYGNYITGSTRGVALPYKWRDSPRPRVIVEGPEGKVTTDIVDVGPWNIDDPDYVLGEERPLAESQYEDGDTAQNGQVPTNNAGIDLTDPIANEVGVSGKGKVRWRFA